ncbi:MAG: radical SAM protein, partial [Treponema sp.]|nr:radical SAM protein [Treponema sp.]
MRQLLYYIRWYFKARFLNKKKPLQTVLAVSDECNMRCRHCTVYNQNPIVKSYAQIKDELIYAYKSGSRIMDFQGGEPTIWKDGEHNLNSLIRLAKEMGFFSVTATTNALEPFPDLESDTQWVSLDGIGSYHDDIRGAGAFEKLLENVVGCNHKNLSANMVVNNRNYKSVRETIQFVRDSPYFKSIAINFHTPYETTGDLFLDWDARNQVIDLVLKMKQEGYPILNSKSGLNYMRDNNFEKVCWISGFILPDGTKYDECPGRFANLCERCGYSMAGEMRS